MSRIKPVMLSVAIAGALATGVIVAPSAQAYVPGAPPCTGSGCYGKSPYWSVRGVACADDATVIATLTISGAISTVDLMYSAACGAKWVDFPIASGGCYDSGRWVVREYDAADPETLPGAYGQQWGDHGTSWTYMVNGLGHTAQAWIDGSGCVSTGWYASGWY